MAKCDFVGRRRLLVLVERLDFRGSCCEEAQVEIRKQKREENLAKRRGIGSGDQRPGASLGAAPDSDDENPPTESQVRYFPFFNIFLCCFPLDATSRPAPHLYPADCFVSDGTLLGPSTLAQDCVWRAAICTT